MKRIQTLVAALAALPLLAAAPAASAFSFTGSFTQDDDVQLFHFSLVDPATVDIKTWSFDGGTNAAGDSIASGGFDPMLWLFDVNGGYLDRNDDGTNGLDSDLVAALTAGDYVVALTQFDNFANGNLSDGFSRAGQPAFTGDGYCSIPGQMFQDEDCNQRTGAWAVDILHVDSAAPVPEPTTALLCMFGLAVLGVTRCRRA